MRPALVLPRRSPTVFRQLSRALQPGKPFPSPISSYVELDTNDRALGLYFSRPIRLFRPPKLSGWHSLRGLAVQEGLHGLSPSYLLSLVKSEGVILLPAFVSTFSTRLPPVSRHSKALRAPDGRKWYAFSYLANGSIPTPNTQSASWNRTLGYVRRSVNSSPAAHLAPYSECCARWCSRRRCPGTVRCTSGERASLRRRRHEPKLLVPCLEGGLPGHGGRRGISFTTRHGRRSEAATTMDAGSWANGRTRLGWARLHAGQRHNRHAPLRLGSRSISHGKIYPGFAAFFAIFEVTRRMALQARVYARQSDAASGSNRSKHLPQVAYGLTLVSGGVVAGLAYEGIGRPFEAARHAVRLDRLTNTEPRSVVAVVSHKIREEGFFCLFRDAARGSANATTSGSAGSSTPSSAVYRRMYGLLRTLARVGPWGVGFLVYQAYESGNPT
ncbi:hypothetical protein HMN09_00037700 [Mycena chlorophos]|uniref:Mitochondrial carrier protein n=1 Tax=Mycena chlorophos TaxID=658473 RepID=A0A8H6WM94_MYCCL|nr:hypothetical protein HMN09_00037700 [Mycena chlorophos]